MGTSLLDDNNIISYMYKFTLLEPICKVIYYTCWLIFKWATIEISKYINVSENFQYFIPRFFKYSNTIFIFGCHSSICRPNRIRLMKSHNLIDQLFLGLFCLFGLFSSKNTNIKPLKCIKTLVLVCMLTVCLKSFSIKVLKYIKLKGSQRVINKRLKKPTRKGTTDYYYCISQQLRRIFQRLGRKMIMKCGDMKTIRHYLKKIISFNIQTRNAVSVLESLPEVVSMNAIWLFVNYKV